jgi:hypothetical protein
VKNFIWIFFFLGIIVTCFTACANKQVDTNSKEGYMTNNNICTQDEYEKTLFGQPISVERNLKFSRF